MGDYYNGRSLRILTLTGGKKGDPIHYIIEGAPGDNRVFWALSSNGEWTHFGYADDTVEAQRRIAEVRGTVEGEE